MKDFFKFLLASMLGFIIGVFVLFGIFLLFISILVSSLDSEKEVSVKDQSVLHIRFDDEISERTPSNPFQNLNLNKLETKKHLGLNDILKNIEKAGRDERIKGIFLDLSLLRASLASTEEIRNAILEFKKSRKFVYAYSEMFSQGAYYVASAADRIYLHPQGALDFKGLRTELMFFKGSLEKLEIQPEIIRHGKYKSAIEPFILDKMSEENRKQIKELIDGVWDHLLERISATRNLPVTRLDSIADVFACREPMDAMKLGIVDKVCYFDEMENDLRKITGLGPKEKVRLVELSKYDKAYVKAEREYSPKKIAVIYAVGSIESGEGNDETIGSDRIAAELRKARLDTSIKAIVFRVNSPGGSALASDVIWREVVLAKKEKPVIASMGDYAASGGYYISCAADTIVAQPTTITGSIGVFGLMFNAQKMFNNKLGITFDTVSTNRYADMGTFTRPMREDERNMIQLEIEKIYDTFISRVAEGRGMDKAQVDSIGQGRIWTGTDAKSIGLVDVIGGIDDAVNIAAKMAKLDNYRIVELPRQKEFFEVLMEDLSTEAKTWLIGEELGDSYKYYREIQNMVRQQGILMRMPYSLMVY